MLGIGLGAFMDGLTKGYSVKQDMIDRDLARQDRDEDRARRARQDAILEEDRAYTLKERERANRSRDAVERIASDAKREFAASVNDGKYDETQFERFWREYALPKMRNEFLLSGDLDSVTTLNNWADSEDARAGTRLFSSALFKSQTGDYGGALDDVISAGKLRGYVDHAFEIGGKEEVVDKDGRLVGYSINITDGSGNLQEMQIALEDIPNVVAAIGNPEAAWQSQAAAAKARAEQAQDLDTYKKKKEIDESVGGVGGKHRADAIKALRDRFKPSVTDPDALVFDSLDADEQERLIEEEIGLQTGKRQAPKAQDLVAFDNVTGQVVGQGDALGTTPRFSVPNAMINGVEDPGLPAPRPLAEQDYLRQAISALGQGVAPAAIARGLIKAGVDPSKWPPELSGALPRPTGLPPR